MSIEALLIEPTERGPRLTADQRARAVAPEDLDDAFEEESDEESVELEESNELEVDKLDEILLDILNKFSTN